MVFNFANGKIYKLVNDLNDELYVGSTTTTLRQRKYQHKNMPVPGVKALYGEIGWKEMKIILVETFPCANNDELRQRERHWFDLLNPSLNRNRPYTTAEEKKKQKAELQQQPKYKARKAEYRRLPERKMKRAEYQRRPEVKARKAEHRQRPENKAKRAERVTCDCGCIISMGNINKHQRTAKHHRLFEAVISEFIHS
jgi:hypothetical protein